jgi:hypothetical protein
MMRLRAYAFVLALFCVLSCQSALAGAAALLGTSAGGLQKETVTGRARIIGDGGQIIDLPFMNRLIAMLKQQGLYTLTTHVSAAQTGVKKDGSNYESKTYDFGPHSNDITQATGSAQPLFLANQQGGKASAQFFPVSTASSLTGTFTWASSPFSVLAVVKMDAYTNYPTILAEGSGTSRLQLGYDAIATHRVAISKIGVSTSSSNLAQTTTGHHIIEFQSNGISGGSVTVNAALDGVAASSALTLTGLSAGTTTTSGNDASSDALKGRIAFLLIVGSNVTSDKWSAVRTAINAWYGCY